MAVETDPRIGTTIAGYRIEALIGHGAMSMVYRAEDTALDREVALKLIGRELSEDERFRERFLVVSALAAALDHPNVIPVYGSGEADGLLYIVMRYVKGADLKSLLARGRLESERVLSILTQLAAALDAARWGESLVHGGLKPSRVLVASAGGAGPRDRVFLGGFGLRQALPPGAMLTENPQQLGTIDYLAPEQIEGGSPNPRTDVYALGCILFECLTGEPPFKGDSVDALRRAHLHEQPPSPGDSRSEVPAGIDPVIAKALAKWPEERYSTCGEFADAAQTYSNRNRRVQNPSPETCARLSRSTSRPAPTRPSPTRDHRTKRQGRS